MSLASISSGSFLLLYGNFTPAEKTILAGRVRIECGKALWQKLMTTNPNVVRGYDIAVIFNSITSFLNFQFEAPSDNYDIAVQCLTPSATGIGTGYVQLNGGDKTIWTTAPSYFSSVQNVPLYTNVSIGGGLQSILISFKDPMAIIGITIKNADMSFDMYISAMTTFLYPNKKFIVSKTLMPDYIVPAINTKIFGPPLTTAPPSTGTPGPDLSCYEKVDLSNMPTNIFLYGRDDKTQKLQTLEQIETYCGRMQWQKLITDISDIISGSDIAVILNKTDSTLSFKFAVPYGTYSILLRCIMPSANSDSGFVRLDNLSEQMFTRGYGPTKYSTRQLNFLLFDRILLDEGYHEISFRFREPIGYIDLYVSRTDQTIPDLVIPAIDALNNPDKIYSDANYTATIIPKIFNVPTTYVPLETAYPMTTTMMPETTTMMPMTTTMMPMTTTMMPETTTMMPETTTMMPETTTMMPETTTMMPMTTTMAPNFVWSWTGNACLSTANYLFGTSSLYIPGTDRVVLASFPAATLSGDWTIEFFVWIPSNYPSSTGCVMSIGSTSNTFIIFRLTSTVIMYYIGSTAGGWQIANAQSFAYNIGAWNHVAITFTGSTYRMYLNGSLKSSAVNSINIGINLVQFNFGSYLRAGAYTFSAEGIYIDAMRVSSVARYISDTYTVPTSMYTYDVSTIFSKNFEGSNGSTNFAEDVYSTATLMPKTTTMTPKTTTMTPTLKVTTTGSVSVSALTSGYKYYTFTGNGATIAVNVATTVDIIVVGANAADGKTLQKLGNAGYAFGGKGGSGAIAYGTLKLTPNIVYTINFASSGVSISSSNVSISATAGQIGKDGSQYNYTARGGAGGNSGVVSVSGSGASVNSVVGNGTLGTSADMGKTAYGGNGGGGNFVWIDGIQYGTGGTSYTVKLRVYVGM